MHTGTHKRRDFRRVDMARTGTTAGWEKLPLPLGVALVNNSGGKTRKMSTGQFCWRVSDKPAGDTANNGGGPLFAVYTDRPMMRFVKVESLALVHLDLREPD